MKNPELRKCRVFIPFRKPVSFVKVFDGPGKNSEGQVLAALCGKLRQEERDLRLSFGRMGNEGGGGGGGIRRSGRYLTFGSAGYKVGVEPLSSVPGLPELQNMVNSLEIASHHKGHLLSAAMNLGERTYFLFDEKELTPQMRAELIRNYQRAIGAPAQDDDITVYAITQGKETYLLPEFFQLGTDAERAVILFHEAEWVLGAKTYKFVIDTEIKFQKFMESKNADDGQKFYAALGVLLDDRLISIKTALMADLKSGQLQAFMIPNTTKIAIENLFGPEGDYFYEDVNWIMVNSNLNWGAIENYLIAMISRYPTMQTFKALYTVRTTMVLANTGYCPGSSGGYVASFNKNATKAETTLTIDISKIGQISEHNSIAIEGRYNEKNQSARLCFGERYR